VESIVHLKTAAAALVAVSRGARRSGARRSVQDVESQNRTVELVIAAMIAALLAGGLLAERGSSGAKGDSTARRGVDAATLARQVPLIARRVESLRSLRFRRRPVPRLVTAAETRREGLAELDRSYPRARRRADEEVLKLLGLIEPDTDLREVEGSVFGEEVAGFYDTRRKRLAVVSDGRVADPLLTEITLAHELVHALEDQRFSFKEPGGGTDDEASARTALVEGTATAVMTEYARRHVSAQQALGAGLAGLGGAGAGPDLPPYIRASLEFSYFAGERFVRELFQAAGGWKLVDVALRSRPPRSTEQVIHPRKFLAQEDPVRVRLRLKGILGEGWRRASRGTVGEFDTAQVLGLGGSREEARRAAEGWGGGSYELWQRGARKPGCTAPCRRRDALVLSWRWDSARDAREFRRTLTAYLEEGLRAERAGRGRWDLRGGAAAVSAGTRSTTLAFAPTARLARALAGGRDGVEPE